MIVFEDIARKVARQAVSTFVERLFFDIACGRPVDGVVWPARLRVKMLRNLRRQWERAERARCSHIVADAERAGVRIRPLPRPWPRLSDLTPRLRAAAVAEPVGAFRARYLLDPFRPTAQRLGAAADRHRRDRALADALTTLDAAFPSTSPRSHA